MLSEKKDFVRGIREHVELCHFCLFRYFIYQENYEV